MFLRKAVRISALLAMFITLSLWVLSYFEAGYFWNQSDVILRLGGLDYAHYAFPHDLSAQPRWGLSSFRGFTTFWTPSYSKATYPGSWSVFIPLWMPTVFFALILGLFFLPFRKRRERRRLGLCLNCGYDLRGTWGRCPECGTAVAPLPAKQRSAKEP